MSKTDNKDMPMDLSKKEKSLLKYIKLIKFVGLYISLMGIGGILIGIYSAVYRPMTPSESMISKVLLLFSFVCSVTGWVVYEISKLVNEFKKHLNL